MNRRGFLRFLGGGAAVATVAAVAPSQVWPFTKIFLPSAPTIHAADFYTQWTSAWNAGPDAVRLMNVQAVELESFAAEIPILMSQESTMYKLFQSKNRIDILDGSWGRRPLFRIPQVNGAHGLEMANGSKIVFDPADGSGYRAKPDVAVSEVLSSLDRDIRRNLS